MANKFGAALRNNMKKSENRVEKAINGEPEQIVNNEQPAPQQVQPVAQSIAEPQPSAPVKPKKTENGIVINVPMADYMQLTMLKLQTGRTLKDLALQAIHEFVERNG